MSAGAGKVNANQPEEKIGFGRGILLLATVTLVWGVNWPMMKRAVSEIPIWTFRAICLVGAAAGLIVISRLAGHKLRIPRGEMKLLLVVSLFNISIWHITSATGLVHLEASRATIIAFTMPLWAALMAVPILGERPSWNGVAGLVLGLAGMIVLLLPDRAMLWADPVGPIVMLTAAISWAIGTVVLKYAKFTMSATVLTSWQLILGGIPVVFGAVSLDRGFDPWVVSVEAWLATAFTVIGATIFCHWGWFKLVRRFPAVGISVGSLAIPVVGVTASAIGLGESVGAEVLIALALVLVALFLVLILPGLRH